MVKALFVVFSLGFVSAYFYPPECWNITVEMEESLYRMSVKFSSVVYFLDGIQDMKEAWSLFPSWLMNCVPFIVNPNANDYSLEGINEDLLEQAVWDNREVGGLEYVKIEGCEEDILACYEIIKELGECKRKGDYREMVFYMKKMGDVVRSVLEMCGWEKDK